jgi:hypothetical protein
MIEALILAQRVAERAQTKPQINLEFVGADLR